jgi:predicted signal transduction protein with EAL and GGDEF domain
MPTACNRSSSRADEHSLIATLPGELDKEKRDAFAHTIVVALGRPLLLHGEEIIIKACIGIADYGACRRLLRADAARHAGRHAGFVHGDACVAYFDPQHDRAASHRMMLERQLRAASNTAGSCCPISSPSCAPAAGA